MNNTYTADLSTVYKTTIESIILYCQNIITKCQTTAEQFMLVSDLYDNVSKFEGEYDDLLTIFGSYFDTLYSHQSFYVRKERYEDAQLIDNAIEVELDFILSFVLQNFVYLKSDITQLQTKIKNYYLS